MKRYRRAAFSAGSVITLSLLLFFMSRNTERSPSLIGTQPNAPGVAGDRYIQPSVSPTEMPLEGALDSEPLASLAPTTEQLQSEVDRNPEGTPQSLIRFSQEVRRRAELAKREPGDSAADRTMSELEACVGAPEAAPQSRLICVRNADRLAEGDPQLEGRARALRAGLSPQERDVLLR